jgi:mono/diheme cytochrome c family protein
LPSSLADVLPSASSSLRPPARSTNGAPVAYAALVCVALTVAGCTSGDSPSFRINLEGYNPADVSMPQRDAIAETMEEFFGTPDQPQLPDGTGLDLSLLKMAAGPMAGEVDGAQTGLFRQHCATCHGISGDGVGALATTFDPYPRDFRHGTFKYTTTRADSKPLRSDLRRTLLRGIPGTGMPSFVELPAHQIDALVEYVVYLSLRGETERYLVQIVVGEGEYLPLSSVTKEIVLEDATLWVAELWAEVEADPAEYVVAVPPRPGYATDEERSASITRGKELYLSKNAQCVLCHGPEGDGEGEDEENIYDDWNKPKQGVTPAETAKLARLYTLPIQELRARDFRQGAFRGGSNPEDLYRRVHIGIKGTPMPAAGPQPGAEGAYTPEEIWDVVHYILSLSGED